MDTPEDRALHVLDILAGLIMDILLFSEPEVAQQIRIFKFQRYNNEFVKKYLK